MKKIVRILSVIALFQLFLFMHVSSYGQKLKTDDVPEDVRQSLEFEHPGAKVSGWASDNNDYIATFKEDGATGKAYFTNDGTWIKSTFVIPKGELPSALTEYVKKSYTYSSIVTSMLQATPEERMHYYIEIKHEGLGQEYSVLTFTDMGVLIKKEDPANYVPEVKETPVKETAKKETPKKETPERETVKKETPAREEEKEETPAREEVKKEAPAREVVEHSSNRPQKEANDDEEEDYAEEQEVKPAAQKAPKKKEETTITDGFGNEAISSSEIPGAVTDALAKKTQRPEKLNWFKIDSLYMAQCIIREQKNDLFFKPNGTWINTYIHVGETAVTGNALKHMNSFYRGWRFKAAIKEVRADKNDKTMVEFYEKDNYKDKLVTTAVFDKTGKLIRSIDPHNTPSEVYDDDEYEDKDMDKYYDKMAIAGDARTPKDIPENVLNAFKTKYPRIANPEWSIDEEDDNYLATYLGARGKEICVIGQSGTLLQTQTLGKPELLSSNIQSYVKKNHKGFKVSEYYAVRDLLDKKNYYKVIANNKKTKQDVVLWFTTSGKVIEK